MVTFPKLPLQKAYRFAMFCAVFPAFTHLAVADVEPPKLTDYIVSVGPVVRLAEDFASPVNVIDADKLSRESGGGLAKL